MSKYLPQELIQGIHVYHGKDYSREITIKHLLSHMSGIADYYTENPEGGKTNFELFLEEPERLWTVEATIERVRNDLEPKFPPGTGASYSDTNFQLLGKILEAISGKPLASTSQRRRITTIQVARVRWFTATKKRAPRQTLRQKA